MAAVGTRKRPLSMNPSISGIRGVLSFLAFASLFLGCSPGGKPPPAQLPKGVPVTIGSAVQKDIPIQARAIGTVEAYSTVSVKTMLGGQIMKVGFSEGQDVRRGDLLFEIDPAPYEAALKMAEAARARDIALKENAEKEVRRYASLVERNLVPRQQYDQFASSAAALEATVQADTAAVENARVQLAYCFIRSPIDGRTGSLLVQRGNIVEANERSGAVVVPSQAIQTGQQGQYVFVVRPDLTVNARPVTTGEVFEGGTVIGKGVAAGEKS